MIASSLSKAGSFLWLATICLITMEVATRVDDFVNRSASLTQRYDMETLYMESDLGTVGRPNARYAKWGLNRDGFRGPAVRADEGQIRIITYGASETFGLYEDEGKEYPRQLEAQLQQKVEKPGVEVVNVSLPGMRLGSGANLLASVGKRLKPRYIFVYPSPAHYIGITEPSCKTANRVVRPKEKSNLQVRIVRKSYDAIKDLLPRTLLTSLRRASSAWTERGRVVLSQPDPRSLDALAYDLTCVVNTIRAANAEPILLTHATRFSPVSTDDDTFWLVAWRQQHPELTEVGLLALERESNAVVRRLAESQAIRLVDVDKALSGSQELFKDYSHFSNLGAGRMATLLAAEALRDPGP